MKWTFDHSRLPVYLQVAVEGVANIDDLRRLLEQLLESEFWHPGMSILVDLGGLKPTQQDKHSLIQDLIRYFVDRRKDIGKSCIATVHPAADAYNYIRRFEYGTRLRRSEVVVRNFMDSNHAAEWLTNHAGMCGGESETDPDAF